MTGYWKKKTGMAEYLRLYTREDRWLAWEDQPADPKDVSSRTIPGAKNKVGETLRNAFNSTNVIFLLGSGASVSAVNPSGGNQAPGMATLWNAVREKIDEEKLKDGQSFDDIADELLGKPSGPNENSAGNIEKLLSLCKMKLELLSVRATNDVHLDPKSEVAVLTDFISQAEAAILSEVGFVNENTSLPAHSNLLRKFSKRSAEKQRVKLFTTNYDLCLEEAGARLGIVFIDGFSHSAEQRFNRDFFQTDIVRRSSSGTKADYIDSVFHLYKMHGSVDWRRRSDGAVIRRAKGEGNELAPVLIYPRSTKYQEAFEMPYLDMFAAFQSALREPDTTIFIAGFGFADDHISSPIWSAVESNLSLKLVLVDPGFIEEQKLDAIQPDHALKAEEFLPNKYQLKLMRLIQQGDNRLTVLNGRFEDLVDAIPSVSGETDRQRLLMRLEDLGGV
ncbi:SIR2 family protein [Brucella tritici]|uniref:SIR2 family protein n=1 Tax=Brucella tritici TaxID=94626 RepID=A0A833CIF7_9HYPH|nr:SIR2 family protein [Brucella tritici]KAB2662431.1 SIR2 family protein [Brucella tritici]KAB2697661.1 SIR2 family protein [Ochrobactrum sp. Kaboul]